MKLLRVSDEIHLQLKIKSVTEGKDLKTLTEEILKNALWDLIYEPSEFAEDEDETLEDKAAI